MTIGFYVIHTAFYKIIYNDSMNIPVSKLIFLIKFHNHNYNIYFILKVSINLDFVSGMEGWEGILTLWRNTSFIQNNANNEDHMYST